jgi:pantoate--beta-alanine ligase
MGYLHDGHVSLIEIARDRADAVVMSLFVNPLQFDDSADLDRYPRDLARDAEIAEAAGVSVLLAPEVEAMYPSPPRTRVTVEGLSSQMEGLHRSGHFEGVATVVTKLFAGLQPDVAVFGRKDAQQLAVVRRLVMDLSFPIEIVGAPTVREPDGLAMSSRNVFLSRTERQSALALSQALGAAADAVEEGERDGANLETLVRQRLASADLEPEYVALADACEASPLGHLDRKAFLALAVPVGPVRLIDNMFLWPDGTVDRGVRLESPSIYGRS